MAIEPVVTESSLVDATPSSEQGAWSLKTLVSGVLKKFIGTTTAGVILGPTLENADSAVLMSDINMGRQVTIVRSGAQASVNLLRVGGSLEFPAVTSTTGPIAAIRAQVFDGFTPGATATLEAYSDGPVGHADLPGSWWICTTPAGQGFADRQVLIDSKSNLALGVAANDRSNFGGGSRTMFIQNCLVEPTDNPPDGVILYVVNGALLCRGSSGTITTIANS